jgi:hypothetical protein
MKNTPQRILVGLSGVVLLMSLGCSPYGAQEGLLWASGESERSSSSPTEIDIEVVDVRPLSEDEASELTAADVEDVEGETELFWQMVNSPPRSGVTVALDRRTRRLAHGPAITWMGCDSRARLMGGYNSNTRCGRALVHPAFGQHMSQHFVACSDRAARRAGMATPRRIFVNHVGTYNNRSARGSRRLSMHAYARALDIANFNLYDSRGQLTRVSTHVRNFRGRTAVFYNEFRQCWRETMSRNCRPGQTEYKGSIGIPRSALGGNNLHNDHIHLSLPLCARG